MLPLALLILMATGVGDEASPAERIARGSAALADLEFDVAAEILMSVVVDPAATDAERFEANVLAGTAHRILGHDNDARLCFRYVLLKQPDFRMNPSKSPKVVQFFELVRQEVEAERAAATSGTSSTATSTTEASTEANPLPMIVVAGGAVALMVGGGFVAFAEASLGNAHTAGEQEGLLTTGRVAAVVAAAGALTIAVGAALWSLE